MQKKFIEKKKSLIDLVVRKTTVFISFEIACPRRVVRALDQQLSFNFTDRLQFFINFFAVSQQLSNQGWFFPIILLCSLKNYHILSQLRYFIQLPLDLFAFWFYFIHNLSVYLYFFSIYVQRCMLLLLRFLLFLDRHQRVFNFSLLNIFLIPSIFRFYSLLLFLFFRNRISIYQPFDVSSLKFFLFADEIDHLLETLRVLFLVFVASILWESSLSI